MKFAQCLKGRGLSLACKLLNEHGHLSKYFEALVTIMVGGINIDVGPLVNLRKFVEDECMKLGGALMHEHFQTVDEGEY